MAAALLGRCVGLLALGLLLYSCCYAFRVRDHPAPPEQQRSTSCGPVFGRCQERSTAATSTGRKWHDAARPARRPPEPTGGDDERGTRPGAESESVEIDDDDDEDVVVEVEEETVEEISDEVVVGGGEEEGRKDYKIRRKSIEDDDDEQRRRDYKAKRKSVEDEMTRVKDVRKAVSRDDDKSVELRKKVEGVKQEDSEDEDDDDEGDEDEDDEDQDDEEEPTPPPRKLEKVRHADKDKVRSAEIVKEKPRAKVPVEEEPKPEKKPVEKVETVKKVQPVKKVETVKKVEPVKRVEAVKKPEDGKSSVEATKRVDKATKSESESPKPRTTAKPDERAKVPVKPEPARKQPETKKVETTSAKPAPAKVVQVKRSDKDEPKVKTKTHVEASLTLTQLNDAILRVPTFVPNFTAVQDFECQQHGKIFLRQLRGYKLWALQMLDSSAKIPPGLLRGNVNQLGDFDQCLGVLAHVKLNEKTIKVQGKYCLASIDLYPSNPSMKHPVNMMQARAFIRGNMHDPGHFIPKFTTVNWALCLPAACSAEDAQDVLEDALRDYNSTLGIKFLVDVDPNMCYVQQKSRSYSKETIGVLYFYAIFICLVVVATVRDYLVASERKGNYSERIIMSFSLRRTVKTLLKKKTSDYDITCIHGIRTLTTIALYVAHQIIAIARLPFSNRIELTEVANTPISSVLRVSLVYTDAFLLLSGVLTAYNMANEFLNRGEIRWFCRFIARYIRLTPALLAVVFWYAFVMEHTGSGPQWNSLILPNAELCKSNAWTNLLYIQNFFPFEEMCAAHTHQLALDMQLSLLAPMLVFFLECRPIIGTLVICFFVLLSATLRYIATMNNYLSLVIFHGMSLKHLYRTANLIYVLPVHRATPYVFGVALGVLLRYTGKDVRIHKVFVILGWLIAMALGSWSLFSPWHLARRDYVYDAEEATNYAVISPVLWALALCWSIFACHTNHGGIINRFLCNHWLVVSSRISYAVYLTQFAVFFYNVGTTRYSSGFHIHRAIDPLEALTVVTISVVLTLFFDLPMQEIKNVLMESTDTLTVEVPSEEKVATAAEPPAHKLPEEQKKEIIEEDEVTLTGWDWQRDIVVGGKGFGNEGLEDEEQVQVPILRKPDGRRRSFIGRDTSEWDQIRETGRFSRDEEEYRDPVRRTRSRSKQKDYQESESDPRMQQEEIKRGRRSLSRSREVRRSRDSDNEEEYVLRRKQTEEEEEEEDPRYRRTRGRSNDYRTWELVGRERSSSRGPEPKRLSSRSEERQLPRPPLSRSGDSKRILSSESEDDSLQQRRRIEKRQPSVEPRISDEEDWENELRIRRKQFMEKLSSQQQGEEEEEDFSSLRRRSSAEGKMALLKDPSADDNMDSWTVSVGSRVAQLGSSQERSEPEEDLAYARRREYREQAPPFREETQSEEEVIWDASRRRSNAGSQATSAEEDEDVASFNFVLTRDSKRTSLQDLSRLSQDDSDLTDSGWNIVRTGEGAPRSSSGGLYKRESIIKSQASEEDPEYLLPERPKLVQQEREHPFKKAWQMQKSRSEEDAYVMREQKEARAEPKPKDRDDPAAADKVKRGPSGEQYEDSGAFADDESESITLARSRSTDTEENTRTSSKSEGTESASFERSEASETNKASSMKSSDVEEDSSRSWPSEDEQFQVSGPRSKSEEAEWTWEREET